MAKKHVSFVNFLAAFIFAAILSLVLWSALDPRLIIFFVVAVMFAEVFVYVRWRASMACPHCGFDPLIYKANPQRAKDLVQKFYTEKIADPLFLLSQSPVLDIYKKNLQIEKTHAKIQHLKRRRNSPAPSLPGSAEADEIAETPDPLLPP